MRRARPTGRHFLPVLRHLPGRPARRRAGPDSPSPGQYVLSGPPTAPPYGTVAPPPWPPGGGYAGPFLPSPNPSTLAIDRGALTYLFWAAILWLCSGAVSLVLLSSTTYLRVVTVSVTGTSFVFEPFFYVIVVVSGAFTIVQVLLLRAAFRQLAPIDSRFSTSSKLALLLIIGFVLVLVGLIPLTIGAQGISGCITNSTNSTLSPNCPGLGDLVLGGLVVFVGGILTLIGYIGCLIGIWRFGSRYQTDLFKVGAILLIIPVLSVVGAILVLVGSHSARERLGAPAAPGTPRSLVAGPSRGRSGPYARTMAPVWRNVAGTLNDRPRARGSWRRRRSASRRS